MTTETEKRMQAELIAQFQSIVDKNDLDGNAVLQLTKSLVIDVVRSLAAEWRFEALSGSFLFSLFVGLSNDVAPGIVESSDKAGKIASGLMAMSAGAAVNQDPTVLELIDGMQRFIFVNIMKLIDPDRRLDVLDTVHKNIRKTIEAGDPGALASLEPKGNC